MSWPLRIATLAKGGRPLFTGPMTNIVFDTDMASDPDDTSDLAMLLRLQQLGEANIIAYAVSGSNIYSAPATEAMNMWGSTARPPIGAYQGSSTTSTSAYAQTVAQEFGAELKNRGSFISAVTALRRGLAAAADNSVCYCVVGSLTNLAALLQSSADAESALSGRALVQAKVRRIVLMGGDYPSSASPEFDFADDKTAAKYVFDDLPVDTYCIGYTVGGQTTNGPASGADPAVNPCKRAYNLAGYTDRPGWGASAVLFAVRGLSAQFKPSNGRGNNVVSAVDGSNVWTKNAGGKCIYLERTDSSGAISAVMQALTQAVTAAAKAYSAFNPNDKSSTLLLLSNSNKRATHSGPNASLSVRGATPMVDSQKKYWEYKVNTVTGSTNLMGLGVANLTHSFSDFLGQSGNSIGYYQDGAYRGGGSLGTYPGVWASGDVISVAYDRANQRCWFRKNGGSWNGSGAADPATNTGGYQCSGLDDGYPIVLLQRAGDNIDIVTDPTAFTYTVPSGFYPMRI